MEYIYTYSFLHVIPLYSYTLFLYPDSKKQDMIQEVTEKGKRRNIDIHLEIGGNPQEQSTSQFQPEILRFVKSESLFAFLDNMFRFDKGIFIYQQPNITGGSAFIGVTRCWSTGGYFYGSILWFFIWDFSFYLIRSVDCS